jgi:hypothetical protein
MLKAIIDSGVEVKPGETVISFRGESGTFQQATRENEEGGRDGKVIVDGFEFYARVYGLRVVEC